MFVFISSKKTKEFSGVWKGKDGDFRKENNITSTTRQNIMKPGQQWDYSF